MNITYFDKSCLRKINVNFEFYERLRSLLKIKRVVGKNFVRVGKHNDGGYIMVDNFKGGAAYSFGINDDVSWDKDIAQRGYDVFMYDPTIDALPEENSRFHFFREGIAGVELKDKNLNTLENFIRRNGHENINNMILKMDVEGAEWSFLSTVSPETLSMFDQIVFEFHFLIEPKNQSEMNATLACVKKLNQTHSLIHLHANNNGSLLILDDKILIPNVLELTYVKTANYELTEDEDIYLPIDEDESNQPKEHEFPLGYWNKNFNNVLTLNKVKVS
ncbi:MAG: FkbM family methyltransferase [Selenomonadaceae bacterium]|nr:FkbM family methyltransferase [Selenomonadaceae bacterium]